MRKIMLLVVLSGFLLGTTRAKEPAIIKSILKNAASEKVKSMQNIIRFDDAKAARLEEIEYRFLLDVQKAENCCLCNSAKKVEKLKAKKDAEIQKILSGEQFLKYDMIDKERIKKYPVRVN